jgi:DNA-binding transcriptional LysR family regulator
MDIVDLRYLAAAANAGNFGRAAKSLGLDTSTISRREVAPGNWTGG